MANVSITAVQSHDMRYELEAGAGADSVHSDPQYSYAVTRLETDAGISGTGLAFTLGGGNDLVCRAIDALAADLVGEDIEALMADFRAAYSRILEHPQYRWLGPHKGVVHLALSSIVNACFDLWAKSRGKPLWQLLLDLSPRDLLATLNFRYIEDLLDEDGARRILEAEMPKRAARMGILERGYPGYDTSIGWIQYADDEVKRKIIESLERGFGAVKLKVGSADPQRDIRRAYMVRETVGDEARVMLDCNQQWTLPQAIDMCRELRGMNPYWIEEPTHPDDVLAHQTLARAIAPLKLAIGEHLPQSAAVQELFAGGGGWVRAGGLRAAWRRQRIPDGELDGAADECAGRAACGRYGADSPTPGVVQSHRAGA